MRLELATRRDPQYRLVSRADEEAAVATRLGRRRWFEGAAYILLTVLLVVGPMYAMVATGRIGGRIGVTGAVGLGVPLAVLAILVVAGRRRTAKVKAMLAAGGGVGFLYWAAALYGGYAGAEDVLRFLGGDAATIEIILTAVASLAAAALSGARPEDGSGPTS